MFEHLGPSVDLNAPIEVNGETLTDFNGNRVRPMLNAFENPTLIYLNKKLNINHDPENVHSQSSVIKKGCIGETSPLVKKGIQHCRTTGRCHMWEKSGSPICLAHPIPMQ